MPQFDYDNMGLVPGNVPQPVEKRSLLGSIILNDSPVAGVVRMFQQSGFDPDPAWVYTEEEQNRILADIVDPQSRAQLNWHISENALSGKHAEFIRDQGIEEIKREQRIAEAGGAGLATRLLANFLMPENIALALATGGAAHLTKIGALRGALRTGVAAGLESAAVESVLAEASPIRDSSDVVYSGLIGMGLGAGAGKLFSNPAEVAALRRAQENYGKELAADALAEGGHLDSAGAMRAQTVVDPLVEAEVSRQFNIPEDVSDAKSAFGSARYDVAGRAGSDQDAWIRQKAHQLVGDPVGLEGHATNPIGASEHATMTHYVQMAKAYRRATPEYNNWLAEKKLSGWNRFNLSKRGEFMREVGDAIRGVKSESQAVNKAASAFQDVLEQYNVKLRQAGVLDEGVAVNRNYLPRLFDSGRVRELAIKFGDNNIQKLVAKAMKARNKNPEISAEVIDQVARGYWKRVRRLDAGMDTGLAHGIRLDDLDFLRQMLREADMDEDLIETTLASTKKAHAASSKVSRAKERLDVDETTSIKTDKGTLHFYELLERDAEKLVSGYSRSMSGWLGLANRSNIKNVGDMNRFMNALKARMVEAGRTQEDIDKNVKRFQFMFDGILGKPLENDPAGVFAKTARTVRDLNFLRIAGAFGFAQIAEIGNIIATGGLRNMIAHVPELRGMIKRAKDGKLSNQLQAEIEDMLAPGVDRLINTPTTRMEEVGFGVAERGLGRKLDDAVQVAKRMTSDLGGLNAATTVFQRMGARVIMQKLLGFAHGAKLSKGQMNRLRGMGISKGMQERIFEQMRKHASAEESWIPGRKKLMALNPDKWDDAEALDTITAAVYRESRRVVQENDIGSSTPWLHSTTGKLMMQFRSFMMTSYMKATLHNIHQRDLQSFNALMFGMFTAGIGYVAQTAINVGDKDRREERLQLHEIAKAAFQRQAIASFIPAVADTAAVTLFRSDPMFAYGRSSGLAASFFEGIPFVDMYDKAAKVVGLPAVIAHPDKDITQREIRNIFGLAPVVGGLAGARRLVDALSEGLPE